MNMRAVCVLGAGLCALVGPAAAHADEIRVRFVERVGSVDTVISDNLIGYAWAPTRIRVQMGVFDDASGPAAGGGLVGWADGSIDLAYFVGVRTPGRLTPFAQPAGGNGFPSEDPFLELTQIDATRSEHEVAWGCNDAVPQPMPVAAIRGRNTFVSLFEVTVEPMMWCHHGVLTLEVRGQARTASGWEVSGKPDAPECPGTPGSVAYSAIGVTSRPIEATLTMIVGAPGLPPPRCPADWNRDERLDSSDFFLYLADFFAGVGDFTCDATVTSEDFFAYLAAFFGGC